MLATTADVEALLRRKVTAAETEGVARLLKLATGEVVDHVGWPIEARTDVVELVDSRGGPDLQLTTLQLRAVHEVTLVDSGRVLDPAEYRTSQRGTLTRRNGGSWPIGLGAVRVKYDDGFTELPQSLVNTVAGMVVREVDKLPGLAGDVLQAAVGGVTVAKAPPPVTLAGSGVQLYPADFDKLARYVLPGSP